MEALRFQAKFLIVSPTQVLHPAQFVVRRGRVVEVVSGTGTAADVDLGEMVVLPGLVNAHTHLEFSQLAQPLPAGASFPEWISQVVAYRRQRATTAEASQSESSQLRLAIEDGLQESFATGTALVGDIITEPWTSHCLPAASDFTAKLLAGQADITSYPRIAEDQAFWEHLRPLSYPRVAAFTEWIGLQAERFDATHKWASRCRGGDPSQLCYALGVSPHAPYSIHFPSLQRALTELAPTDLLAMHIAESTDEVEWLEQGQGAFRRTFERLGLPIQAPPPSIEACIAVLAQQRRALLIHGNYLTRAQIAQIAAAPGITVVYCPRTHAHFDHAPYPLQALREAGVSVVLATDSRASNPSLSLWDEVVAARSKHRQWTGAELLHAVTLGPAVALGVDRDFGSLEVGRLGHACTLAADPAWTPKNLLDQLSHRSAAELGIAPLMLTRQNAG